MRKEVFRVALSFVLLLTPLTARAARGRVTKAEEAEARAVASAFMDRFFETHDFATVAGELYVSDYMQRYIRSEYAAPGSERGSTFMLEGVPSLTFGRQLAAHPESDLWPRLFVAANNFMHYGLTLTLSRKTLLEMSDPEKLEEADIFGAYPPEALKVLDANPSLANFLKRKGDDVDVETLEELRAVTEGMEQAERLTRAGFEERVPATEKLEQNLAMMRTLPAQSDVTLVDVAKEFGYPEGTRLFKVFAPVCYDLILVKEGEKMKVVWAFVADD